KQRFLHHCPLAHHRTVLPMPGTTESELHTDSNTDFFNGIEALRTMTTGRALAQSCQRRRAFGWWHCYIIPSFPSLVDPGLSLCSTDA
ncbi:hypothetical protein, partial [Rhizobium fabae]|uniref:hypothetical protein n=1 Tax=Rhizobium fabae TaxID=573179 RepID=UPI001ABFCD3C